MIGCDKMAKKKKVKKKAKRIMTFGLFSVLLIIVVIFTLLSVFVEIINTYEEKQDLENKLVALEKKEKQLETDVKKLEDPEYLARYAREKYFYSKDGELIIRIPEDEE